MKLNSEKREAFDPQYLVQFFHQFPNIVPKYRLSNASKLSRQTCHKKKRQSMIPPQRNSNRSSARYVDYRENLIFFLSLSLATIPFSTRINPSFFGGGNGRSESIRPWRVTGSGGRRVTRLVMPAGKGALSASLKAIPRVVRNNTACELVRAWRRNGTEPVAASTSTTPREIGFFFRVVRLPEPAATLDAFLVFVSNLDTSPSRYANEIRDRSTLSIISRPSSRDEEDNRRVMGWCPCSWIRVWVTF